MKFPDLPTGEIWEDVAPLAGAWIEILGYAEALANRKVAPLAGAWIEIDKLYELKTQIWSLPSRERGLILYLFLDDQHFQFVFWVGV